jgi:hypothetical protein
MYVYTCMYHVCVDVSMYVYVLWCMYNICIYNVLCIIMYVCIYVRMCVCVYVCMYVCIYVCMYNVFIMKLPLMPYAICATKCYQTILLSAKLRRHGGPNQPAYKDKVLDFSSVCVRR